MQDARWGVAINQLELLLVPWCIPLLRFLTNVRRVAELGVLLHSSPSTYIVPQSYGFVKFLGGVLAKEKGSRSPLCNWY